MGIDFPSAPTVGQKHPVPSMVGVPTYTWDGEKWIAGGVTGGKTPVYPDGSTAMTAQLTVVDPPINPTDAASKAYVDTGDANSVRVTAQSLAAAQQERALTNVYAAPFDSMAYSGMQINGACEISQENGTTQIYGGPGGTTVGAYVVDGWLVFSNGVQSISWGQNTNVSPPPGYTSGFGIWSNVANNYPAFTDYLIIRHAIEGYRIARLGWGTASAQPISIGFWFACTNVMPLSVVVKNASSNRCYIANFNVNVSGVMEWKTFTIPGDVTGTWGATNGVGLMIEIGLMAGNTYWTFTTDAWVAGNFFQGGNAMNAIYGGGVYSVTGLIVVPGTELPSPARAPLIMRPYTEELLICSRYLQFNRYAENGDFFSGYMNFWHIPVVNYRTTPTISLATSSFYIEVPWQVGINVTGGAVNNNHMSASGGDYLLSGTVSYTPAYNASIAMMQTNVVKFNARL